MKISHKYTTIGLLSAGHCVPDRGKNTELVNVNRTIYIFNHISHQSLTNRFYFTLLFLMVTWQRPHGLAGDLSKVTSDCLWPHHRLAQRLTVQCIYLVWFGDCLFSVINSDLLLQNGLFPWCVLSLTLFVVVCYFILCTFNSILFYSLVVIIIQFFSLCMDKSVGCWLMFVTEEHLLNRLYTCGEHLIMSTSEHYKPILFRYMWWACMN